MLVAGPRLSAPAWTDMCPTSGWIFGEGVSLAGISSAGVTNACSLGARTQLAPRSHVGTHATGTGPGPATQPSSSASCLCVPLVRAGAVEGAPANPTACATSRGRGWPEAAAAEGGTDRGGRGQRPSGFQWAQPGLGISFRGSIRRIARKTLSPDPAVDWKWG